MTQGCERRVGAGSCSSCTVGRAISRHAARSDRATRWLILLEWSLRCQCLWADSTGLRGPEGAFLPPVPGGVHRGWGDADLSGSGRSGQEGSWGTEEVLQPPVGAETQEGVGRPCPLEPGGHGHHAQACRSFSTKARPPSGSSCVPEGAGLHPGALLSPALGSGKPARVRVDGREGRPALAPCSPGSFPSQGEQDDRSYKLCRTSSPSSAGSVSLGRYTPTSRSPQHYSRPGTWPHGLFASVKLYFLLLFL